MPGKQRPHTYTLATSCARTGSQATSNQVERHALRLACTGTPVSLPDLQPYVYRAPGHYRALMHKCATATSYAWAWVRFCTHARVHPRIRWQRGRPLSVGAKTQTKLNARGPSAIRTRKPRKQAKTTHTAVEGPDFQQTHKHDADTTLSKHIITRAQLEYIVHFITPQVPNPWETTVLKQDVFKQRRTAFKWQAGCIVGSRTITLNGCAHATNELVESAMELASYELLMSLSFFTP